jgi:hypothetical protein
VSKKKGGEKGGRAEMAPNEIENCGKIKPRFSFDGFAKKPTEERKKPTKEKKKNEAQQRKKETKNKTSVLYL